MNWLFVFFFVSGFASILYELIWLRLAMAQFGVTTAFVSIVLSTFMAGLGLGSWAAGYFARGRANFKHDPLRLYGLAELIIGIGALAVPFELEAGSRLMQSLNGNGGLSSGPYYLLSGLILVAILVPWCAAMGSTIPLAMFAIKNSTRFKEERSFSFLYVANVVGSIAGAIVPLLLIELNGFRGTLQVGALLNFGIAAAVFLLTRGSSTGSAHTAEKPVQHVTSDKMVPALLFATGVATMGMEVVWIRLFTPYIGQVVYSFALVLVTYLTATFIGSRRYRTWASKSHGETNGLLWVSLSILGMLPLITSDLRLEIPAILRVVLGVGPVAGVIGFLTPMLVDRWSEGDPERAGKGYAFNVAGCILGPLLAGFILLPMAGEHLSLLLFSLPWFALMFVGSSTVARVPAFGMLAATLAVFFFAKDYETRFPHREVRRDATATVIAAGEGMQRQLLTNGQGMTVLTPVTKMMAHITLASLDHTPRNALVICFGMGTTFRSLLSWGVETTAVELVPSVPKLFGFYHADSQQLLAAGRVVIDDGRRFLDRSGEQFDVIMLDPPPPVTAAGSSLLYSEGFYTVAKPHLRAGGILQQWLPAGDEQVHAAVARALKNSFPYVEVHPSVEGWGWHFLASMTPIPHRTPQDLVARMPAKAVTDMMEWGPGKTPEDQIGRIILKGTTLDKLIARSPQTPALTDDRPINEYFILRAALGSAATTPIYPGEVLMMGK